MDNELVIDPDRQISFQVDTHGFEVLRSNEVHADVDLLEQSINNLLDNAGKYSYSGTTVRVYGGLTGRGRFHISVINRGLALSPADAKRCVERGWRSDDADLTTGEGSGIGLWLVDNIMRAHGGELLLIPTVRSVTEVKLLFRAAPRQRVSGGF